MENSSSADSRLRTGGELAWTTTTIEMIEDPAGATIPPIGGRAAQGAPIHRRAGNRITNGGLRPMIETPIIRIADIPRKTEAPPERIALIPHRIEAPPVRIALILRKTEVLPVRIVGIPRRTEVSPARIAHTLPQTERIMARAVPPPAAVRARRAPAAAIRLLRGALPAPVAAPAVAAMAVPPAIPAGREKRKRSANTSSAFNRAFSL